MPRVWRGVQHSYGSWSPSVRPLHPEAEDHREVLLLHDLQVVVLESGGVAASQRDYHAQLRVPALRQELPHRKVSTPSPQDPLGISEICLRGLRQSFQN